MVEVAAGLDVECWHCFTVNCNTDCTRGFRRKEKKVAFHVQVLDNDSI